MQITILSDRNEREIIDKSREMGAIEDEPASEAI